MVLNEPHGVQHRLKVGRAQQEHDFYHKEAYHISYFQNLGTLYMFIGYFFNGNPNFEVTSVLQDMSRVQVSHENGNSRDQDRE